LRLESLKSIISLEIPTNRIFYDKKSSVLSVEIIDFMFVGIYKKSVRLSLILNDIFTSLGDTQLKRADVSFVDFVTNTRIPETTKLKNLKLLSKKKLEKKEEKPEDKGELMVEEKEIEYEIEEEPEEKPTFRDAIEEELFKFREEEILDEDLEELRSFDDDVKFKDEYIEEEKALKRDERKSEKFRRIKEAPKALQYLHPLLLQKF